MVFSEKSYVLPGYGKFLPLLVEGPDLPNPMKSEMKIYYAFNISTDPDDHKQGLGFVYLLNFGYKFSSMLNHVFDKPALNLSYS